MDAHRRAAAAIPPEDRQPLRRPGAHRSPHQVAGCCKPCWTREPCMWVHRQRKRQGAAALCCQGLLHSVADPRSGARPPPWHPLNIAVCHADGSVSLLRELMGALGTSLCVTATFAVITQGHDHVAVQGVHGRCAGDDAAPRGRVAVQGPGQPGRGARLLRHHPGELRPAHELHTPQPASAVRAHAALQRTWDRARVQRHG